MPSGRLRRGRVLIVVFRVLGISNRSRSGKRKPKPGQNAQAESDLGKDDKNGGAEESENGSDGSEDFPGEEQPDDPQLSDGHQSDGSQRSDDSGSLALVKVSKLCETISSAPRCS